MTFDMGVLLETQRLLLRPFEEGDTADVLAASRDPEILRWMPWAPAQTAETALAWCVSHAHVDPTLGVNFAIVAGDRFAGTVGLGRTDWADGRVEVGYWIAPWARRKGYAVEATRAAAAYAFEKGLHRVELLAAVGNLASQGVAAKAGFTREGVLRQAMVIPAGRVDAVLFSLLESELT
ncbi:GNAT family N-acetyltransferase [Actinoallomurus soli]|uniref:GNAT family N-acetyltransferase n=1 Tax=Actinoallomurus soli TaxID=2952535 RepID=UPI0020927E26|nr:GNAT family protein [Actinoallomurus soli]MCO5974153.1 GNAT family N-acetyltransferase [Actinoallomurus soli]